MQPTQGLKFNKQHLESVSHFCNALCHKTQVTAIKMCFNCNSRGIKREAGFLGVSPAFFPLTFYFLPSWSPVLRCHINHNIFPMWAYREWKWKSERWAAQEKEEEEEEKSPFSLSGEKEKKKKQPLCLGEFFFSYFSVFFFFFRGMTTWCGEKRSSNLQGERKEGRRRWTYQSCSISI